MPHTCKIFTEEKITKNHSYLSDDLKDKVKEGTAIAFCDGSLRVPLDSSIVNSKCGISGLIFHRDNENTEKINTSEISKKISLVSTIDSTSTEILAATECVRWAKENNYKSIIVHTDSQTFMNMLDKGSDNCKENSISKHFIEEFEQASIGINVKVEKITSGDDKYHNYCHNMAYKSNPLEILKESLAPFGLTKKQPTWTIISRTAKTYFSFIFDEDKETKMLNIYAKKNMSCGEHFCPMRKKRKCDSMFCSLIKDCNKILDNFPSTNAIFLLVHNPLTCEFEDEKCKLIPVKNRSLFMKLILNCINHAHSVQQYGEKTITELKTTTVNNSLLRLNDLDFDKWAKFSVDMEKRFNLTLDIVSIVKSGFFNPPIANDKNQDVLTALMFEEISNALSKAENFSARFKAKI